ncbi:hypothetical protein DZD52_11320 [Xanthomonas nasturtii]|uniref:Uncharacterized protein n=1 Tax=Xanthomonas nasturtii TaxID=1843581 RepID=A0A3E1KJA2_9XANT|nr:hypothetical protein DZD52_11320 [Xanthomonas nasturtii]
MRATGARALERPRRKRGPGRGAGVRVRGRSLRVTPAARGFARTPIRPCGAPSPSGRREALEAGIEAPLPPGEQLS